MRPLRFLNMRLCCFVLWIVVAAESKYRRSDRAPNIVMIVADDLGWGDVGFNDPFDQIRTPYIDALAAHGVTLDNYYTAPMCTPSRSELLTGRYANRVGMQHYVVLGSSPYGLPLDQTLLPQKLKSFGYATHMIGKWHLGHFREEYLPTSRGFDSFYGFTLGLTGYYDRHTLERGMWGLDLRNGTAVDAGKTGIYSTELFTDEAVRKIREHGSLRKSEVKGKVKRSEKPRKEEELPEGEGTDSTKSQAANPLFLMINHQSPHGGNDFRPYEVPLRYLDRVSHIENLARRNHAALLASLDDAVARVVKALDEEKLLEETVLVFTTDNGGAAGGYGFTQSSNWPLRGVKASTWEGGVKGVGFVWSPLLDEQKFGTHYRNLMHISDWLPTFVDAASIGGDWKKGLYRADEEASLDVSGYSASPRPKESEDCDQLDGVSHWSNFLLADSLGKSATLPPPRKEALLMLDDTPEVNGAKVSSSMMSAIRVGDYKLVWGQREFGFWSDWYLPDELNRKGMKRMLPLPDILDLTEVRRRFEDYEPEKNYEITEGTKEFEQDAHYYGAFKKRLEQLTEVTTCPKYHSTRVDCGAVPPPEILSRCDPTSRPCLFNIARDPCEYFDLADSHPEIAAALKSQILAHAAKSRKPANRPPDPSLDPKFNGGVWGVNLAG